MNDLEALREHIKKISPLPTLLEYIKQEYNSILSNYYTELNNTRMWRIPLNCILLEDNVTSKYFSLLKEKPAKEVAKLAKGLSKSKRNYDSFLNQIFRKLDSLYHIHLQEYENLFDLSNLVFQFIYIEEESSVQSYLQLNIQWGSNEREFGSPLFQIAENIQNRQLMKPMIQTVKEIKNEFVTLYQLDNDLLNADNFSNSDSYLRLMQLDGDNIVNGYFISSSEY